jgi:hypothetical protein
MKTQLEKLTEMTYCLHSEEKAELIRILLEDMEADIDSFLDDMNDELEEASTKYEKQYAQQFINKLKKELSLVETAQKSVKEYQKLIKQSK